MSSMATTAAEVVPVLFANNYDMALARAGWRERTYPGHHLFGTAQLGRPFEVIDLPYPGNGLLAAATRRTRGRLGDLGQQLAVRRPPANAIVYGATAKDLRSLAIARALGAFRTPIVGVFQPFPTRGRLGRLALQGFDRAIAMSRFTQQQLLAAGMPSERIVVLGWGADLAFPGFAPPAQTAQDARVVATGKTGRDMATLLAALGQTGLPACIYGEREQLARTGEIPAGVEIVPASDVSLLPTSPLSYDHTLADLRAAAVVAIPLVDPRPLHGLTEVVDALACARPMIVTRAPYFDFDIEEIGCGWWVDRGDVRGWSERLSEAMADRERLHEMGRAGRAWAGEHLNAQLFEDGVREVLLEVAAGL
jgi:glycosyltransferase involved in cell wall biosynthesis